MAQKYLFIAILCLVWIRPYLCWLAQERIWNIEQIVNCNDSIHPCFISILNTPIRLSYLSWMHMQTRYYTINEVVCCRRQGQYVNNGVLIDDFNSISIKFYLSRFQPWLERYTDMEQKLQRLIESTPKKRELRPTSKPKKGKDL